MTPTPDPAPRSAYPEGTVLTVDDMGPIERAYAEAMHEDCDSEPKGHPLSDHAPWSGGDLDGTEPWDAFMARLARHGLTIAALPSPAPASEPEPREDGVPYEPPEPFEDGWTREEARASRPSAPASEPEYDADGELIRPDPHSADWYDGYAAATREWEQRTGIPASRPSAPASGEALDVEHAASAHYAQTVDCGDAACPLNWRRTAP